jgi:hypothetical protein
LIFPAHEQHHNNSFLCAALVMGQSNMAAGATIGSNHNSRGADGELQAGRGFWPGLCVSLKHNSKFASFTLIAKGDYPAELNIPIPFSLISNDVSKDQLVVMPAYWFMYNMYALGRNEKKYSARDNRTDKTQELEYDYLAPDSVNEIFDALHLIKKFTGKAYAQKIKEPVPETDWVNTGAMLLNNKEAIVDKLEILAEGFENSDRKVQLVKVNPAYQIYKELIIYYGISQLVDFINQNKIGNWQQLWQSLPLRSRRESWVNIGGQLIPKTALDTLIRNIETGKIRNWDEVHNFYNKNSKLYREQKLQHAFASLIEILDITPRNFTKKLFRQLLAQAADTKEWMLKEIYESRSKDYFNEFRKMMYDNQKEMDNVVGKLSDNSFILQQEDELRQFRDLVNELTRQFQ